MIGQAVATNTEAAIKPLAEKVDALQANQKQLADTLTANSRAEEKAKRDAVAKVHGDIVANALSGDALDAMFRSLGEAAFRWAPTMLNSTKKPAHLPQTNTSSKETE